MYIAFPFLSSLNKHLLALVMSKALPSGTKADIVVRNKKVANILQEKFLSLPPSPPALKSKYKIQLGFKKYGNNSLLQYRMRYGHK